MVETAHRLGRIGRPISGRSCALELRLRTPSVPAEKAKKDKDSEQVDARRVLDEIRGRLEERVATRARSSRLSLVLGTVTMAALVALAARLFGAARATRGEIRRDRYRRNTSDANRHNAQGEATRLAETAPKEARGAMSRSNPRVQHQHLRRRPGQGLHDMAGPTPTTASNSRL